MATAKSAPVSRRARLFDDLARAGREHSTATVLFHSAMADQFGLTATDTKSLELLGRLGPLSAGELVEHTGLASPSVTALIDRLEAKGLVRRLRDASDRRRVIVEMVPEGLASLSEAFSRFGESLPALWSSYTNEQLEVILDFLDRSAERLRAESARLAQKSIRPARRTRETREKSTPSRRRAS